MGLANYYYGRRAARRERQVVEVVVAAPGRQRLREREDVTDMTERLYYFYRQSGSSSRVLGESGVMDYYPATASIGPFTLRAKTL